MIPGLANPTPELRGDKGPGWRAITIRDSAVCPYYALESVKIEFRGDDRFLANGDDSGQIRYGAINPTVGIVFRPAQTVSVYASYGRGFETPTLNELAYRPDGSAGFNTGLAPARSNNYEVGAKAAWLPGGYATAAAFWIDTEDEIVIRSNAGGRSTFANAGATRRRGLEVSTGWQPRGGVGISASVGAIHAEFSEPFLTCTATPCVRPSVAVAAGNRLPGVPAFTASIEARYRLYDTDLSLDMRALSPLYVDDRNTDRAAGYATFNFVVARTLEVQRSTLRVFLRIDNLLDRNTIGSVIVNESNGRYFEPAPPRTWLAGLDIRV